MGQIIKNGICYSGGSGSAVASKLVIDTLWDAIITEPGSYTLAKSIDDYDFLIAAVWGYVVTDTSSYEQSNHLVIPKKDYYLRATSETTSQTFLINSSLDMNYIRRVLFSFTDDTTLCISRQDTSMFRALYGVKLDQSGSGGISPSGGSYPNVPIYLGSQVLFDSVYCSSTSRQNFYLVYKGDKPTAAIGAHNIFKFPMDIPEGYTIKYRLSASIATSDGNRLIVGINGVDLIRGMTWNASEAKYTVNVFSDLFSFEDFPDENAYAYNTTNLAYNMYCKNDAAGNGYARNVTIHGYLVKEE